MLCRDASRIKSRTAIHEPTRTMTQTSSRTNLGTGMRANFRIVLTRASLHSAVVTHIKRPKLAQKQKWKEAHVYMPTRRIFSVCPLDKVTGAESFLLEAGWLKIFFQFHRAICFVFFYDLFCIPMRFLSLLLFLLTHLSCQLVSSFGKVQ